VGFDLKSLIRVTHSHITITFLIELTRTHTYKTIKKNKLGYVRSSR